MQPVLKHIMRIRTMLSIWACLLLECTLSLPRRLMMSNLFYERARNSCVVEFSGIPPSSLLVGMCKGTSCPVMTVSARALNHLGTTVDGIFETRLCVHFKAIHSEVVRLEFRGSDVDIAARLHSGFHALWRHRKEHKVRKLNSDDKRTQETPFQAIAAVPRWTYR